MGTRVSTYRVIRLDIVHPLLEPVDSICNLPGFQGLQQAFKPFTLQVIFGDIQLRK